MLILCIGDLHIPHRACDLPSQFKELLKPGKIHSILSTGNLCCKSQLEYLKNLTSDVQVVQGDFDEFASPENLVVTLGEFRIGVLHGHQVIPWGDHDALACIQRQLDVDILVSGHTHEHKALAEREHGALGAAPRDFDRDGGGDFMAINVGTRLQINPGSATGAFCSFREHVTPSFILLDLEGLKATVYMYQLIDGKVKVEKLEYTKPGGV